MPNPDQSPPLVQHLDARIFTLTDADIATTLFPPTVHVLQTLIEITYLLRPAHYERREKVVVEGTQSRISSNTRDTEQTNLQALIQALHNLHAFLTALSSAETNTVPPDNIDHVFESLRRAALLYLHHATITYSAFPPPHHQTHHSHQPSQQPKRNEITTKSLRTLIIHLVTYLDKTDMFHLWAPQLIPGAYVWGLALGLFAVGEYGCAAPASVVPEEGNLDDGDPHEEGEREKSRAWFRAHSIYVYRYLYGEKKGRGLHKALDVIVGGAD